MKKIFKYLFLVCFLFANSGVVFGQTNGQVSIIDIKLDKDRYVGGETIKGIIKVKNFSENQQANLSYTLSLIGDFRKGLNPNYSFESKEKKEIDSLLAGEEKEILMEYTLPTNVPYKDLALRARIITGDKSVSFFDKMFDYTKTEETQYYTTKNIKIFSDENEIFQINNFPANNFLKLDSVFHVQTQPPKSIKSVAVIKNKRSGEDQVLFSESKNFNYSNSEISFENTFDISNLRDGFYDVEIWVSDINSNKKLSDNFKISFLKGNAIQIDRVGVDRDKVGLLSSVNVSMIAKYFTSNTDSSVLTKGEIFLIDDSGYEISKKEFDVSGFGVLSIKESFRIKNKFSNLSIKIKLFDNESNELYSNIYDVDVSYTGAGFIWLSLLVGLILFVLGIYLLKKNIIKINKNPLIYVALLIFISSFCVQIIFAQSYVIAISGIRTLSSDDREGFSMKDDSRVTGFSNWTVRDNFQTVSFDNPPTYGINANLQPDIIIEPLISVDNKVTPGEYYNLRVTFDSPGCNLIGYPIPGTFNGQKVFSYKKECISEFKITPKNSSTQTFNFKHLIQESPLDSYDKNEISGNSTSVDLMGEHTFEGFRIPANSGFGIINDLVVIYSELYESINYNCDWTQSSPGCKTGVNYYGSVSAGITLEVVNEGGQCGTAAGQFHDSIPTENLCSVGTPTTVSLVNEYGTDQYSWQCIGNVNGSSSSTCAAQVLCPSGQYSCNGQCISNENPCYISGMCGYSLFDNVYEIPQNNLLCYQGNPGTVTYNNVNDTYNWTCFGIGGAPNDICSVNKMNCSDGLNENDFDCPVCGFQDGNGIDLDFYYNGDYSQLCDSGNINYYSINLEPTQLTWQCNTDDGSIKFCSADINYAVSQCGSSAGEIFTFYNTPDANLCSIGSETPVTINSNSYDWQCLGSNTESSADDVSCSATRCQSDEFECNNGCLPLGEECNPCDPVTETFCPNDTPQCIPNNEECSDCEDGYVQCNGTCIPDTEDCTNNNVSAELLNFKATNGKSGSNSPIINQSDVNNGTAQCVLSFTAKGDSCQIFKGKSTIPFRTLNLTPALLPYAEADNTIQSTTEYNIECSATGFPTAYAKAKCIVNPDSEEF